MHYASKCAIILGLSEMAARIPGCSADGSALEWGSRGRWFKSSHSDQLQGCPLWGSPVIHLSGGRTSGLLPFQSTAAKRPGRRPSPHRPLVQIQSLGPKSAGFRKKSCTFSMPFDGGLKTVPPYYPLSKFFAPGRAGLPLPELCIIVNSLSRSEKNRGLHGFVQPATR